MNKYLTFPGRQPVYLGDIDFMQDAVQDTFAQLLKAYTGLAAPTAILYGLELTTSPNSISWTAGVICLAGEILPIPAGGLTGTAGGPYYFNIVTEHSGEREMGDGIVRPCLQTRTATISETSSDYPVASTPRINPVDMYNPRVYDFTGISNSSDYYARLADCAGSLNLVLRRPAMAEASQTAFQAAVDGLPSTLLAKLSSASNPSSIISFMKGPAPGFFVTVSWSVSRGVATFTVTLPESVTQVLTAWEIREIIPVF